MRASDILLNKIFKYNYCKTIDEFDCFYRHKELTKVNKSIQHIIVNTQRHKDLSLAFSSKENNYYMVQALLLGGANIHVCQDLPIRWASVIGCARVIPLLIEGGADLTSHNSEAIKWACNGGFLNIVDMFYRAGANIRVNHDIPLIWAIETGNLLMAIYLINRGANIHAQSGLPFIVAFQNKNYLIIHYIIQKTNAKYMIMGQSCLLWACKNGLEQIVDFILVNKDNYNQDICDQGLRITCKYGYISIVKKLLAVGANPRAYNNKSIHVAKKYKHLEIYSLLIDNLRERSHTTCYT